MAERYARVYHQVKTDPKFETIYNNDHHLAWWLRLLVDADAAWPSYPSIPRRMRKASFDALVAVGLIDPMPGDCFRVHGLDAERNARAKQATHAAAMRWQSVSNAPSIAASNAPASATRMPSRAEQSRAEQNTPEHAQERAALLNGYTGEDEDAYETVKQWMAGHGAWVDSTKLQTDLARLVDRDGADVVLRTMGVLWEGGNTEAAQLIYGARNTIHPLPRVDPRAAERQEHADDERKHHEAELARTRRVIEEHERRARQ